MATIHSLEMPVTYTKLLVRDNPVGPSLLRNTGIDDLGAFDDLDTIPVAAFLQVVRNFISVNRQPNWHLEWASSMADHFHGPLSFALMSAPTLGAGIDAWIQFVPARIPYFDIIPRQTSGFCGFEIRAAVDLGDLRDLLVEIPLLIIHNYTRTLGAPASHLAQIELTRRRSADTAHHEDWFTCPIHFDAPCDAFQFPRAWCEIANPAYDVGTWRASIAKCELVEEQKGGRNLVAKTRALVAELAEESPGELTQEAAARRLHVSVRTLIRHLKQAGTSFQSLRDEAFKDKALQLLRRPGLNIHDIASLLGYSDAANFGRAFKRWFGLSPGAYRKTIE